MKKVTNYLLLFFMSATVLFVTSCGEDGEILPDLGATITGLQYQGRDTTGADLAPGAAVRVDVAYDLEGATGITLQAFVGDSAVVSALPLSGTSPNPVQTNFTVPSNATEDIVVSFELQESDGTVVDSEDFNITVEIAVEATVYETVLLAAPLGQTPGERNSKTFFSATNGNTYTVDEVVNGTNGATSDSIHFGYYYGRDNLASIASPAEYPNTVQNLGPDGANWGTLNETMFREIEGLTSAGFDDITLSDAVESQFETASSASESGEINQIAVGSAYAFSFKEGDETRFGIFRVDEINPGDGVDDSITLTVKVAQD